MLQSGAHFFENVDQVLHASTGYPFQLRGGNLHGAVFRQVDGAQGLDSHLVFPGGGQQVKEQRSYPGLPNTHEHRAAVGDEKRKGQVAQHKADYAAQLAEITEQTGQQAGYRVHGYALGKDTGSQ